MSTPATTGPTRERITRKKWEEHPTPDDARVWHLFPGYEHDGTPPIGARAYCGYMLTCPGSDRDVIEVDGLTDGRVCIVCTDLCEAAGR